MKKIILIVSLIILSSCKKTSLNQDVLRGHVVLEKKEQENRFDKIEIDYTKDENSEVRVFKFNHFNLKVNLVDFFKKELTYLKVEKGTYHFIAHNFSIDSDKLENTLLLFNENATNNLVFLFRTYSDEFPAFNVIEIDQENNINDHGIVTYNWADVNKINITNFDEINYTVKRGKNNLEVYAEKSKESNTILSEKYKVTKGIEESFKPNFNLLIQQLEKQDLPIIADHWYGDFSGSFLRMKQESRDPRAWASINMSITKDSTVFKLFSYIEEHHQVLTYFEQDQKVLILKFKNNDDIKKGFGKIIYSNKEYFLDSPFIDSIVGEIENKTYKLDKVN